VVLAPPARQRSRSSQSWRPIADTHLKGQPGVPIREANRRHPLIRLTASTDTDHCRHPSTAGPPTCGVAAGDPAASGSGPSATDPGPWNPGSAASSGKLDPKDGCLHWTPVRDPLADWGRSVFPSHKSSRPDRAQSLGGRPAPSTGEAHDRSRSPPLPCRPSFLPAFSRTATLSSPPASPLRPHIGTLGCGPPEDLSRTPGKRGGSEWQP
jgi:hypothetical protein